VREGRERGEGEERREERVWSASCCYRKEGGREGGREGG